MNVTWVGLGKLGAPCALALANAGHDVIGYDTAPHVRDALATGAWPHAEPGVNALLSAVGDRFRVSRTLIDALAAADVVMVAVQTPHGPGYGGEVPTPAESMPFDTSHLVAAVLDICTVLTAAGNPAPVVVVSTVLPGTCRSLLEPITGTRPLVYSPAFVAMGSVLADLAHPEFVLAGVRDRAHAGLIASMYHRVDVPLLITSIESAELAKTAYNCVIGTKILVANALGELSEAVGADVDEVTGVLAAATDRVASARYLSAGMGDGGPCHGRDNQAMSWLATKVGLSADPFGFAVHAREAQAERLASVLAAHAERTGLPVVICGRAYKERTNIEDGSVSLLVAHYAAERWHDVHCAVDVHDATEPAVYLAAVPDRCPDVFPVGSVVVDPWGKVGPQPDGVTLVRPGRYPR